MDITYIYHSSFSVELAHHVLLFDYVEGELPVFPKEKKLLVFVSHAHGDHFHKKIFDLREKSLDVQYILSDDIVVDEGVDITFVKADGHYTLGDVLVMTLASTDEGVAFLLEVEGKTIYHGGDLNWWDWGSEDTLEESKAMEELYLREIKKLSSYQIDVAFVPLDPRLQDAFGKGMIEFLRMANASIIFPMHLWEDYGCIRKMKKQVVSAKDADKIQIISTAPQTFHLEGTMVSREQ